MAIPKLTIESILSQPAVKHMLDNPDATQLEVSALYGVPQPTLSFWLRRLRAEGYAGQLRGRRVNSKITVEELLEHPAVKYMVEEGATQMQAADRFGVSQPVLSKWVRRLREEGYADKLPSKTVKDGRLVTASGPIEQLPATATYPVTVTYPVTATATKTGTYHTDIKLQGSQAFATPISTATTDGAANPHFPEHALALVNPDATPTSGDFVLTIDSRDGAAAIKRLQRNGEKTLLMSLNPALEPISAESQSILVAGVVEEVQHTPYRRTPRQ